MKKIKNLEIMAKRLRIDSLKMTTEAGSGHPTSCLSCAEIISTLFFDELGPDDEFILSKGHAAPILWAAYAEAQCIPRESLKTLRKIDSYLEGHPTARMPMVRVATGSLGQGLSAGVGISLAKRLMKNRGRTYVLLGDGECSEGAVWEAASSAAYYRLNRLCAVVDVNRLGQSGETMHGHDLKKYEKKFRAFGWATSIIDGHNVREILTALERTRRSRKPSAIIAKTIKGKGVSFLEDRNGWHGVPLKREDLEEALREIGTADIGLPSRIGLPKRIDAQFAEFELNRYRPGEMVATRTAFGNALVNMGEKNEHVILLDGDVKNSTMTEYFFKAFPERAFQSFIAEQNMVGMAVGFSAMGFIPFLATFSAFLTRAYDFIRMSSYSFSNIKFAGSHAGVSIGADGPSQMGLEDIPMFLNIPHSVVLYPSDAVSTEYLVREMAKHKGISYIRTTRSKTPVIYTEREKFPIGGFKVLRKSSRDSAMVIGVGETLFEAIKAYEKLKKRGINIRVVDLYSLKPVDSQKLIKNAEACNNLVVTVEDHYCSALGSVVSTILGKVQTLCITEMPQSGTPEQLKARYHIDSSAIVKMIDCMIR